MFYFVSDVERDSYYIPGNDAFCGWSGVRGTPENMAGACCKFSCHGGIFRPTGGFIRCAAWRELCPAHGHKSPHSVSRVAELPWKDILSIPAERLPGFLAINRPLGPASDHSHRNHHGSFTGGFPLPVEVSFGFTGRILVLHGACAFQPDTVEAYC